MDFFIASTKTIYVWFQDWVEKEGFSHAVINVDPDTEIFHIESLSSGTDIAAYVYTNRHGSAAGTKGYSAAHR